MNTKTTSRKGEWIQLNQRRATRTAMLLLLFLLTLPAVVQAQASTNSYGMFSNSDLITINDFTDGTPLSLAKTLSD